MHSQFRSFCCMSWFDSYFDSRQWHWAVAAAVPAPFFVSRDNGRQRWRDHCSLRRRYSRCSSWILYILMETLFTQTCKQLSPAPSAKKSNKKHLDLTVARFLHNATWNSVTAVAVPCSFHNTSRRIQVRPFDVIVSINKAFKWNR